MSAAGRPIDVGREVGVLQDRAVERTLVVMAHPDDVDFGAAGTVASWTAAGTTVTYLMCTDGDAGGFDPAVARPDISAILQTCPEDRIRDVIEGHSFSVGRPSPPL